MFDMGDKVFIEIDGKTVEFKNWRIVKRFDENMVSILTIPDGSKKLIKETSLCDCGAEKAKTTHSSWCSTI